MSSGRRSDEAGGGDHEVDAWALVLLLAPAAEAALLVASSLLERWVVDEPDGRGFTQGSTQSVDLSLDADTPSVEISAARNGPAISVLADRDAATRA